MKVNLYKFLMYFGGNSNIIVFELTNNDNCFQYKLLCTVFEYFKGCIFKDYYVYSFTVVDNVLYIHVTKEYKE